MAPSVVSKLQTALMPNQGNYADPNQTSPLFDALRSMGVLPNSDEIRQNPVLSNEFVAAHPRLGAALNDALWAVSATPQAPEVSGAGSGISRTVAGIMGGPQLQANYVAQQAMAPLQVAGEAAKVGQSEADARMLDAYAQRADAEATSLGMRPTGVPGMAVDRNGVVHKLQLPNGQYLTDIYQKLHPHPVRPAAPVTRVMGSTTYQHDPSTNKWLPIGAAPTPGSARTGLTPGEIASGKRALNAAASRLETWKGQQYSKAQQYLNKTFQQQADGTYKNMATGQVLTPDQYNKLMYGAYQQIENNYANARNQLGLPTEAYKYPRLSGQPKRNRDANGRFAKPNASLPSGNGAKLTDPKVWSQFLQAAGGDSAKAEQLARKNGWQ